MLYLAGVHLWRRFQASHYDDFYLNPTVTAISVKLIRQLLTEGLRIARGDLVARPNGGPAALIP
jgi:hypothetical protein